MDASIKSEAMDEGIATDAGTDDLMLQYLTYSIGMQLVSTG